MSRSAMRGRDSAKRSELRAGRETPRRASHRSP